MQRSPDRERRQRTRAPGQWKREPELRFYSDREQSSALRTTLRLIPGAGVTPAEGSVKPTAGFITKSYCMIYLLSDDAQYPLRALRDAPSQAIIADSS